MLVYRDRFGAYNEWHLGNPVPDFDRVTQFQVDGDELYLFIQAMSASAGTHPIVDYGKVSGFQARLDEQAPPPKSKLKALPKSKVLSIRTRSFRGKAK